MNSGTQPKVCFLVMSDPRNPASDLGFVKIGITRGDVAARILSIQAGHPYDLHCFGLFETLWASQVEHFMHRTHAKEMHKNEWLTRPCNELASLVTEPKRPPSVSASESPKSRIIYRAFPTVIRGELLLLRSGCISTPEKYKTK